MLRVFEAYVRTLVKTGSLTLELPSRSITFGDGTGPELAIRFMDQGVVRALIRNPVLRFCELYMDGRIEVTRGSLFEVQALLARSMMMSGATDWARILDGVRKRLGALQLGTGIERARSNVAHHYDLDGGLYRLFLDRDMQYSCGYFEPGRSDLEAAQLAKKRHIAAKLMIEPGKRVLDIGCGWGGMALYLAQFTGAQVKGITLSTEQLEAARERAASARLSDRVTIALEDYRQTQGPFDRIVSVGMLEHVGRKSFPTYFKRIAELLTDDGVALVHTIGYSAGPAPTNEFVDKYIFPGGYIPALSELAPAIEAAGLFIADIEVLRLHYAETIRAWRENFARNRDEVRALYDERFCRMWDLYLCGAENAFRVERAVNFQIQLCKKVDALPLTRSYMAEREEQLRRLDSLPQEVRLAGE